MHDSSCMLHDGILEKRKGIKETTHDSKLQTNIIFLVRSRTEINSEGSVEMGISEVSPFIVCTGGWSNDHMGFTKRSQQRSVGRMPTSNFFHLLDHHHEMELEVDRMPRTYVRNSLLNPHDVERTLSK